MTSEELQWAAGFFEGEGHVSVSSTKKDHSRSWHMAITSTDLDALEKWQKIVGFGHIYQYGEKWLTGPNAKPKWRWVAHRAADVMALAETLRPHMCSRRRSQIDASLAEWKRYREELAGRKLARQRRK